MPSILPAFLLQKSIDFVQEQDRHDVGKPLEPDSTGSVRSAENGQRGLQPPAFNKGER